MNQNPLLPLAVKAWGQTNFNALLKQELLTLKQNDLPLYQATEQGGFVVDDKLNFSVQTSTFKNEEIKVNLFVFFYELVVGCGCGDDPFETPVTCEMLCTIDTKTAEARFIVVAS